MSHFNWLIVTLFFISFHMSFALGAFWSKWVFLHNPNLSLFKPQSLVREWGCTEFSTDTYPFSSHQSQTQTPKTFSLQNFLDPNHKKKKKKLKNTWTFKLFPTTINNQNPQIQHCHHRKSSSTNTIITEISLRPIYSNFRYCSSPTLGDFRTHLHPQAQGQVRLNNNTFSWESEEGDSKPFSDLKQEVTTLSRYCSFRVTVHIAVLFIFFSNFFESLTSDLG